jgi:hypothetical protein
MRDDTGVVFASAFPGYDAFADDLNAYRSTVPAASSARSCATCGRGCARR